MTKKRRGSQVEMSTSEIIAMLKRSKLATVLIEGGDDAIVLRRIEDINDGQYVSVLPVGGRDKVLEVFERRKETGREDELVFVCDKDTWCVTGVPDCFHDERLLTTHGYSIENDVIADGSLTTLLSKEERTRFEEELISFIEWYALALSRYIERGDQKLKIHPNAILDDEEYQKKATALVEGEVYPEELRKLVLSDPITLVRGKSLLALLMRQLSYPGRMVRHRHDALMESVGSKPGDLLSQLFKRIEGLMPTSGEACA